MRVEELELEAMVKTALPERSAREEFKMVLREQLLRPEQMGSRRDRKTGGFWRPVYAVGAVAAVLAIALLAGPMLLPKGQLPQTPQAPEKQLALLPSLAAMGRETQGAAAGPGFTVELDYQLTQALGQLPKDADVYRYAPIPFSPEAVQAVGQRLGVEGPVHTEAWQDAVAYSMGQANEATLFAFPDGYYNYNRLLPENLTGRSLPGDAVLTEKALGFAEKLGFSREELHLKQIQRPEDNDVPAAAWVVFAPVKPAPLVSVVPYFAATVGADGEVYGAGWVWPQKLESQQPYPLRAAADAWAAIEAGKGKLVIDYRDVPGPETGTVVNGLGKVDAVSVGYILTYGEGNEVVLQPVAAFAGTATFSDGKTVPFTVYTEAVEGKYYTGK